MKLNDFIAIMEQIAPAELAQDYDNVGLLVGSERSEINHVLIALDCTPKVVDEAVNIGADLILTHHPLFFNGIKRILPCDPSTAAAYKLVKHGIAHYCAHTNLDAATEGVNDVLSRLLGLTAVTKMPDGIGRFGEIKEPVPLHEFAKRVSAVLKTDVNVNGDSLKNISRVAIVGGSGGNAVTDAANCRADLLVTGEIKHDKLLDAQVLGLAIIAAGHYESERVILTPLIEGLQKFENGIQYSLTQTEKAPFWAFKQER